MRERLFLPALSMVMIITAIVSSLGAPLIPQMVYSYGVSLEDAQWVLTISMLTGAVSSPLIGRLGSPGRQRTLLLACLSLVTLGLLLSALPLGFALMLVGRALQGIGIALAPIAMSLARDALGPEASLPAIANLSAALVAAAGLSFPMSSLLAGVVGISGAYWVGFGLAALTIPLVWVAIPREHKGTPVVVDWWGALLLTGGGGALVLLLSRLHSWSSVTSVLVALASTALIVCWVLRSMRVAEPLIDLRLAASPAVSLAHTIIVIAGLGTYLMIPLVMLAGQDDESAGLSQIFIGFLLVPYSLLSVLGARTGNALRRWVSLRGLLLCGSVFYLVANVLMALWHSNVWALLIGMGVAGMGSGFTFAVIPQMIVTKVPQGTVSSALSFNMLLRYIGFSIGSALAPVLVELSANDPSAGDVYAFPFAVAAASFAVGIVAILLWNRRGWRLHRI